MINFKFEFRYAEEKASALRQTGGSIPKGRCVVFCALLAAFVTVGLIL